MTYAKAFVEEVPLAGGVKMVSALLTDATSASFTPRLISPLSLVAAMSPARLPRLWQHLGD